MSIDTWQDVEESDPGSSQWCPLPGTGTMPKNLKYRRFHSHLKRRILFYGWSGPERLSRDAVNSPSLEISELWSWTICSSGRVLGDFQRFLQFQQSQGSLKMRTTSWKCGNYGVCCDIWKNTVCFSPTFIFLSSRCYCCSHK